MCPKLKMAKGNRMILYCHTPLLARVCVTHDSKACHPSRQTFQPMSWMALEELNRSVLPGPVSCTKVRPAHSPRQKVQPTSWMELEELTHCVPALAPVSQLLGYWTEGGQASESWTGKVLYYYVYFRRVNQRSFSQLDYTI